jgi:4-hydroxy-tetrahydrodipicolinate synthase
MKIRGLIPATCTPYKSNGEVDYDALAKHIADVGSATGLFGVAVNGHAGEVLALTSEEKQKVVATARKALPADLKLVAGIDGHSIDALVQDGLNAKQAGADLLLVVPPFDVRTYRHLSTHPDTVRGVFERLDREVDLPMIVFQYPDASGCAYSLEALSAIADLRNVVGIKAGVGSPTKYAELQDALHDRLSVLAACDAPALLGMLLHNAPGALIGISVVGTQQWSDLVREATQGSAQKAKEIHNTFAVPLMDAIFENQQHRTATSPFAATKEALVQLGRFPSSWVRPPEINVDEAKKREIAAALVTSGLLKEAARAA